MIKLKIVSLIMLFFVGLLAGCAMQNGSHARAITLYSAPIPDSPFVRYDSAVVEAIEKNWNKALKEHRFKTSSTGKVVVQFHLYPDGTVTDVKMMENHVTDQLGTICKTAVRESAPFAPWPSDMVKLVGRDYREINFTFNYY